MIQEMVLRTIEKAMMLKDQADIEKNYQVVVKHFFIIVI